MTSNPYWRRHPAPFRAPTELVLAALLDALCRDTATRSSLELTR